MKTATIETTSTTAETQLIAAAGVDFAHRRVWHLRKVFAKLDITSRRALAGSLGKARRAGI